MKNWRCSAIVVLLALLLGNTAVQAFDGMQMPLAGMASSGYNGQATWPLRSLTYSTVWTGDYASHGEGSGVHSGVDIPVPTGTTVYAVASGTVVQSIDGWNGGWGNNVIIRHDVPGIGTVLSCYAHLSKRLVGNGFVSKGTPIGLSGSTGDSTGPHLHFQIDRDKGATHPYWPGSIQGVRDWTYDPISA